MSAPISAKPVLRSVTPVAMVQDLKASKDYYTRCLGFHIDWGGEEGAIMTGLSRDACKIMVFHGVPWFAHERPWAWICFDVEAVDELFDEFQERGARIIQPPTNYSWQYEMTVEDLDGNKLVFGTEPRYDQPYHQPG